jgi:hypothetical protein
VASQPLSTNAFSNKAQFTEWGIDSQEYRGAGAHRELRKYSKSDDWKGLILKRVARDLSAQAFVEFFYLLLLSFVFAASNLFCGHPFNCCGVA